VLAVLPTITLINQVYIIAMQWDQCFDVDVTWLFGYFAKTFTPSSNQPTTLLSNFISHAGPSRERHLLHLKQH